MGFMMLTIWGVKHIMRKRFGYTNHIKVGFIYCLPYFIGFVLELILPDILADLVDLMTTLYWILTIVFLAVQYIKLLRDTRIGELFSMTTVKWFARGLAFFGVFGAANLVTDVADAADTASTVSDVATTVDSTVVATPMSNVTNIFDSVPDVPTDTNVNDLNDVQFTGITGQNETVVNNSFEESNLSSNSDSKSISSSAVEDIRIADSDDKSILTVQDGTVQNAEGIQVGKIYTQENSIVAEDMRGMPVGSTDGQFIYDEAHKPTAVVDHNAEITTVHHSDGSVTNEHGGDIIDGKTGKVIGRTEKI